jgi:hypothetical protein
MATFPTVRNGAAALYPVARSNVFATTVKQFCDDSEQRWVSQGAGLAAFKLTYTKIMAHDVDALLTFWRSMKAAFDSTWSIALDGTTYANMYFTDDNFVLQEVAHGLFDLTLACAEWRRA